MYGKGLKFYCRPRKSLNSNIVRRKKMETFSRNLCPCLLNQPRRECFLSSCVLHSSLLSKYRANKKCERIQKKIFKLGFWIFTCTLGKSEERAWISVSTGNRYPIFVSYTSDQYLLHWALQPLVSANSTFMLCIYMTLLSIDILFCTLQSLFFFFILYTKGM